MVKGTSLSSPKNITVMKEQTVNTDENNEFILDDVCLRLVQSPICIYIQNWGRRHSSFLIALALGLCCLASFFVRLFAVIKYEAVIHEYDPHFNYRATRFIEDYGAEEFGDWFDDRSWYPFGRPTGGTTYSGMMITTVLLRRLLNFLAIDLSIREVSVFLGPIFAPLTVVLTYLMTKEIYSEIFIYQELKPLEKKNCQNENSPKSISKTITKNLNLFYDGHIIPDCFHTAASCAGLFGALFITWSPAYMSRSVAGSYDYEATAIFSMSLTFYFYILAMKSGSILTGALTGAAAAYMAFSWGGYVFLNNVIAAFTIALVFLKKIDTRHQIAYTTYHTIFFALQLHIRNLGAAAVCSKDLLGPHLVFIFIVALELLKNIGTDLTIKQKVAKHKTIAVVATLGITILAAIKLTNTGILSDRILSLLLPMFSGAKNPLVASISEHQATLWSTYIFENHVCMILMPVGCWIACSYFTDGLLFIAIYSTLAVYFSSLMVRLILLLSPGAAILSAVAITYIISKFFDNIRSPFKYISFLQMWKKQTSEKKGTVSISASIFILAILAWSCYLYVVNGTWASATVFSNPSIISSYMLNGRRVIVDDFREAYSWLRHNTPETARIAAWWDYGYQLAEMSRRITVTDNNTSNHKHISTVAYALVSPEETAHAVFKKLHVDYVLVVYGGVLGYNSDDLNKVTWMIKIAGSHYPEIQQHAYFNSKSYLRFDSTAAPAMKNSLLYKLSFYKMNNFGLRRDSVRDVQLKDISVSLTLFKEVYSTTAFMIRIYKVL